MGQFHARDGWYFERLEDGSVRLFGDGSVHVDLDPDTWASAVASVTAQGENRETFDAARKLHG